MPSGQRATCFAHAGSLQIEGDRDAELRHLHGNWRISNSANCKIALLLWAASAADFQENNILEEAMKQFQWNCSRWNWWTNFVDNSVHSSLVDVRISVGRTPCSFFKLKTTEFLENSVYEIITYIMHMMYIISTEMHDNWEEENTPDPPHVFFSSMFVSCFSPL